MPPGWHLDTTASAKVTHANAADDAPTAECSIRAVQDVDTIRASRPRFAAVVDERNPALEPINEPTRKPAHLIILSSASAAATALAIARPIGIGTPLATAFIFPAAVNGASSRNVSGKPCNRQASASV